MSASGVLWSFAVSGLAAAATLAAPSDLVVDSVPGYELTSGPAVDLDYAAYLEEQPGSVAHLDPESEAALGMLGAVEVWTAASGETILIEIIRAVDGGSAATFVDQTAANAIAVGLGATDPPFGGAWSYSGGLDDDWTNLVSWSQGPYAVTLTHTAGVETDRALIDALAVRQAEAVLDATGAEVSEEAAVADDAPPPPTEPTIPPDDDTDDVGGFPVAAVTLGVGALVVVALIVTRRRRTGRAATVVGS
jgi:hypothetical protein